MNVNTREWTYDEIVQTCRDAVEQMDQYRFLIGDTALQIESHYGDHDLIEFSKDIGQNHSTVKGWKRVSKAYSQKFRAELFEEMPQLTYTYLRDALRYEGGEDELRSWLRTVTDNNWTADGAARELTKMLGHKTIDSIEGYIVNFSQYNGKHIIEINVGAKEFNQLKDVERVIIRAR